MAPKDYVKRAQANKQGQTRNARNTQGTTQGQLSSVQWVKVLIALAVVGVFVFGLYRLTKIDIENTPEQIDSNTESAAQSANEIAQDPNMLLEAPTTAVPDRNALPVLGEEEWAYIDSLPDYSVEVDATGPLQSGKEFIMQCGSFRTSQSAEELRAKIAFQGLESRILTSEGTNGRWYRVVLGPYERKRTAERQRHQLRSASINGCKIW